MDTLKENIVDALRCE